MMLTFDDADSSQHLRTFAQEQRSQPGDGDPGLAAEARARQWETEP